MSFIKKNLKNIFILVVILAVVYYGYTFFFKPGVKEEDVLISTPLEGASVGQDLLFLLADLRTIKLDSTIFSDPLFIGLKNFRAELSPEPAGRPNPFAPLSGSGSSGTVSSGIQIRSFDTR